MKGVIHWMIIFGLLCTSAIAFAEKPVDYSGNWKIHTTSHRGYETWETKIMSHEGKYQVLTVQPYLGRSQCTMIMNGNEIKMVFTFSYGAPGADATKTTFTFTGIVDGDTMRGMKTTTGQNTHGDDKPVAWVAMKIYETY
jgi:hypothetical protein